MRLSPTDDREDLPTATQQYGCLNKDNTDRHTNKEGESQEVSVLQATKEAEKGRNSPLYGRASPNWLSNTKWSSLEIIYIYTSNIKWTVQVVFIYLGTCAYVCI